MDMEINITLNSASVGQMCSPKTFFNLQVKQTNINIMYMVFILELTVLIETHIKNNVRIQSAANTSDVQNLKQIKIH